MNTDQRPRLSAGCLSFLIVAAVAGLGAWVWIDSRRGWSVDRLEQHITGEIPANASRQDVEQWFDSHAIDHRYLPGRVSDTIGNQTITAIAGYNDADTSGSVRGDIRGEDANTGFLRSGRITIYFFFNKDRKLLGHYIDPFSYSF
jgi:hypothetical protein